MAPEAQMGDNLLPLQENGFGYAKNITIPSRAITISDYEMLTAEYDASVRVRFGCSS